MGFFSGAGEMEEDEMEDFMEAATDLKPRASAASFLSVLLTYPVVAKYLDPRAPYLPPLWSATTRRILTDINKDPFPM